jgi:hypothetical protein
MTRIAVVSWIGILWVIACYLPMIVARRISYPLEMTKEEAMKSWNSTWELRKEETK